MKKIVFILGSYAPNFSATANCAEKIIKEFKKDKNYKIIIIAQKSDLNNKEYEIIEGNEIYRVTTKLIDEELESNKNFIKKISLKIKRNLKIILNERTVNEEILEKYYKVLLKIDDISMIIPIIYPMESLIASVNYKKTKNVKIVPIIFDNFIESVTIHRFRLNKFIKRKTHEKLEINLLKETYKIIYMNHFKNYTLKFKNNKIYEKFLFMEHPLLENKCKKTKDNKDIKIIFAGTLIKGYVDPRKTLKILKNLKEKRIYFFFYNRGNCSKFIDNIKSKNIINCESVSKTELEKIYADTNIFFNIGEVKARQVSSKVFEYMSYGKPIIHFSYNTPDTTEEVLKKYPLSLIIKVNDDIEKSANKIKKFIKEKNKKNVSYDILYKGYKEADPYEFKKIILKLLTKGEVI